MLVLGLETSGDVAGVALADAEGLLLETRFRHRLQLSRDLHPTLQQALSAAGCSLRDLQGIAVSAGPGSFTGLRIGITAAKSLAYALEIPVAPVSTLEALAWETPPLPDLLVCTVQSASKKDLFAGLYRWRDGRPEPVDEEILTEPQPLAARLGEFPERILVAGLVGTHRETLQATVGDRIVFVGEERLPAPGTIARIGLMRFEVGDTPDPQDLAPRYLRLSTPEQRRQEALCPGS